MGEERDQIQQAGDDVSYKVPLKLYWYDGNVIARFANDPPTDVLNYIPIEQDRDRQWYVTLSRPHTKAE